MPRITLAGVLLIIAYIAILGGVIWGLIVVEGKLLQAIIGLALVPLLGIGAILFKPLRESIEPIISPMVVQPEKCRILFIGRSRSGKTGIIRQVVAADAYQQEESTEEFDIYEEEIRLGLQNPYRFKLAIADYKGQRISDITVNAPSSFVGRRDQRLINAIIFVVDLFPELVDERRNVITDDTLINLYGEEDAEGRIFDRVAEHNRYITEFTIEQIFTLAYGRDNLFSVRLLINKADLFRQIVSRNYLKINNEDSIEEYVRKLFDEMSSEIKIACDENNIDDFSVHLVSAKTRENIQTVFSKVYETYRSRSSG